MTTVKRGKGAPKKAESDKKNIRFHFAFTPGEVDQLGGKTAVYKFVKQQINELLKK